MAKPSPPGPLSRRAWRGGESFERGVEYLDEVGRDLLIRDSHEPQTRFLFQDPLTLTVLGKVRRVLVDGAVNFQRELEFGAVEIEDEAPNGVLASELQPAISAVLEYRPDQFFGLRQGRPELPRRTNVVASSPLPFHRGIVPPLQARLERGQGVRC